MNFYIADMHFGHKNIIRYDNRPFGSVEEMDKALIQLWNETVGSDDIVYILGDFSWYKEDETAFILGCLKGHKVMVKGNHDHISPKVARNFDRICEYAEIKDGDEKVILSHYPIPFWNGQHRNTIHLYGHVHKSFEHEMMEHDKYLMQELYGKQCQMFNVGAMMPYMDYTPRTIDEILKGAS